MSLTKSAAIRRRSLLTGSSLVAAGLCATATLGTALLVPATALAQACSPDPATVAASGPGADAVTCTVGATAPTQTFDPGISYVANGDLTVTTTGPVIVSTLPGGDGINLDATGTDYGITWISTAGSVTGGAQTNGAVIDVMTDSGAIDINPAPVVGFDATITHGIRANSSDGGSITINATQVTANNATSGVNAIEAVTTGDISITTSQSVSGTQRSIFTNTVGGSGSTTITLNGGSISGGGIEARTGTGSLLIDIVGTNLSGGLTTNTGGAATIKIGAAGRASGLDLTAAAGTTTTVDNLGVLTGLRFGSIDTSYRNAVITRAAGAGGIVVNNDLLLMGSVNLSESSGGSEINVGVGARWRTAGTSLFGSDADVISVGERGLLGIGPGTDQTSATNDDTIFDFGGGADVLANAGVFIVGVSGPSGNGSFRDPSINPSNVQLLDLSNFNNSGTILLGGTMKDSTVGNNALRQNTLLVHAAFGDRLVGSFTGADEMLILASDRWTDDMISMPGATFTGAPGGRVVLDVNLMGAQAACDTTLRAANDDLVADCLRIVGGETAGVTQVAIVDVFAGDRGIYNPEGITLIDVNGGTSAAGHFIVDPLSSNYSAANGGVIDKGAFFFPLVYDEDTQRHKLVGLVSGNAAQFPLLAGAAQSLWRVSTGSWLERQADLRGGFDDGSGGGVWLRINSELADRDSAYSTGAYGATFDFDNSFSQTSYAVTGGFDVMAGGQGDTAYVLGLMAGYSHADIDFDASPNTGELDGWTGGAYASLVSGGLFVDAVVNANKLDLKNDVPALGLFPAGTILDTHLLSVGGQVEAGWRIPMGGGVFVEPLAGVSYVRTTYDDLEIPAGDPAAPRIGVEFDDPASLRAAIGGRVGLDQDFGGLRAQFSGLVKVWNEFDGETTVTLQNVGADPAVTDDFSGQFTELGVGASLYSPSGMVSGFVNLGGKFGDDYEAQTGSIGVRVTF